MRLVFGGAIGAWLMLVLPAAAQPVAPGDLGGCVWTRMGATFQDEFLAAYRQDMRSGMDVLQKNDAAIAPNIESCAGRSDIPRLWSRGAVGSQAIQNGAMAQLLTHSITAAMLDATWRSAPPAAMDCVAANAAKTFGIMDRKCPDPAAGLALLAMLKISPQADRDAAAQALTYFNARAQEQWAEALMAKMPEKH
jgi:hypothetical protein